MSTKELSDNFEKLVDHLQKKKVLCATCRKISKVLKGTECKRCCNSRLYGSPNHPNNPICNRSPESKQRYEDRKNEEASQKTKENEEKEKNKISKLERSVKLFVLFGHKIDLIKKVADIYCARTVQAYLSEVGKLSPGVFSGQLEIIRGKRVCLKLDEFSLNYVGKIYSPHTGIAGMSTPGTTDKIDAPATQVIQFVVTDIDTGVTYVGPYFFVPVLSSREIEKILTKVCLGYMEVCTVSQKDLFVILC